VHRFSSLPVTLAVALAAMVALAACDPPAEGPPPVAPLPPAPRVETSSPGCPSHIAARPALANVPPPPGWIVVAAPGQGSETLSCANLARREWTVSIGNGGGVDIAERGSAVREDAPLPFTLPSSQRSVREHLAGRRHALKVDSGYIVGFDAGEHGGALWWFSPTGDKRVQLADVNIVGLTELRVGLVALSGLSHMGMSEGKLLRITREHDGPGHEGAWSATPWIDMHGAVDAFVRESPESMLVLSATGLDRVTACGDVTRIATTNYDVLYPSSIAIDSNGIVYVGMRQFVTRFVPAADGYHEEWLTREDCPLLVRKKFECSCHVR
jgi:hypothetical protein